VAIAGLVEWTIAGIVIGAVYKPAAQFKSRSAVMV
jgi:hypothetical protein